MTIKREFITYTNPLTSQEYSHHILYSEGDNGDERFLLSHANIYLSEKAASSKATSDRYSRLLQQFFMFLIKHRDEELKDIKEFFLLADNNSLKMWQVERIIEREIQDRNSPSEKTVFDDACIVSDFYLWLKNKNYPSPMNIATKEWVANFTENFLLSYIRSKVKEVKNNRDIKVGNRRFQEQPSYEHLTNEQISKIFSSYNDPVYVALFKFCMTTGLRRFESVLYPYRGFGENSHISLWENMDDKLKGQSSFPFIVEGKGDKVRTVNINIKDFKEICKKYRPLLIERRALYKKNHNKEAPFNVFWFNKAGEPVTPKMITDATTHANTKVDFHFEFYDSRHWYATMFMIEHLKNTNGDTSFNSAVNEALQAQLGHKNIETTFKYYIDKARLYIEFTHKGNAFEVVTENGFLSTLNK